MKNVVYYYEQDVDNLLKVALGIQKVDGYYEFYIHHNSSYILIKIELNGSFVSNKSNLLDLNRVEVIVNTNEENEMTTLYVVGGIILFVFS